MMALAGTFNDSSTMLRRVLRHSTRNPVTLFTAVFIPVFILFLMTYAFGGALNTHGVSYVNYVVPGIIVLAACYSAGTTAVAVSTDMNEGIIDRFRTMAIARTSVLTGHVIGNTLRTLFATALVVLVALAIGFRPTADPVRWIAAIGLVTLLLLAISWLSTAIGLVSKNPQGASLATVVVLLLPYLSSAFVPTNTMPGWLQWFTANQPLTPIGETVRGLLMGNLRGSDALLAVAWCSAVAIAGYVWARVVFNHRAAR
jgi:ABC-2 type transport system permease protein